MRYYSDLSISQPIWEKISDYFSHGARKLESAQFNFFFNSGSFESILSALQNYQNFDGGFGHGIEPDFSLPESSPMATSVALKILSKLPINEVRNSMIKQALTYLKTTFRIDRNGWYAVPRAINEFPHAPWWNYNPYIEKTIIDNSWGNPSAELVAYLYQYRDLIQNWSIDPLIEYAVHYFEKLRDFPSEHEIYCFLHLYHYLLHPFRKRLYPNLKSAIDHLIELDSSKWNQYVPIPYKFALFPEDVENLIPQDTLYQSLLFLKRKVEENIVISPSWEWNSYPNHWSLAKKDWMSVLTLQALMNLSQFSGK